MSLTEQVILKTQIFFKKKKKQIFMIQAYTQHTDSSDFLIFKLSTRIALGKKNTLFFINISSFSNQVSFLFLS